MSCYKGSADSKDLVSLLLAATEPVHLAVQGYLNRATAGVKGLGTSAGSSM